MMTRTTMKLKFGGDVTVLSKLEDSIREAEFSDVYFKKNGNKYKNSLKDLQQMDKYWYGTQDAQYQIEDLENNNVPEEYILHKMITARKLRDKKLSKNSNRTRNNSKGKSKSKSRSRSRNRNRSKNTSHSPSGYGTSLSHSPSSYGTSFSHSYTP
jgi:hypothetical protein